jgi:ATP-dependent helicase HrpA
VAFFAGKLPEEIASVRAFEAWYRRATPAAQAALHWSLDDVLSGASATDAAAFPPRLEVGGQGYRLEYRFMPGDPADGVTLHVPLALLNALPAMRCEWLVPGLLVDKVAELIRGLPKGLRRNFVPAPDFARAFVAAEAPREESLAQVLAAFLQRTTGVAVGAADFAAVSLPAHLQMRFELHDEGARGQAPRVLADSRDLAELRARWQARARTAFADRTDLELNDTEATSWDFAHIPEQVAAAGGLTAYPALVDLGDAVALRVFERAGEARAAHRAGVTRLLRHALATAAKATRRRLPISQAVALKYLPFGTLESLRHDLVEGAFADVLARHALDVRDAEAFASLCAQAQRELVAASIGRLELAEAIIEAHAEFQSWRYPPRPGFAGDSYADLEEQHDALLTPGFLHTLPRARLAQLPRYLKAMRLRAERLRLDPARDRQRLSQVMPYWRAWLRHQASGADAEALDDLRWLLEEWRVSLFAQELKTAEPVSAKRLARALARL